MINFPLLYGKRDQALKHSKFLKQRFKRVIYKFMTNISSPEQYERQRGEFFEAKVS